MRSNTLRRRNGAAVVAWIVFIFTALMAEPCAASKPSDHIISQPVARQHGLYRMWVTRVELDRSRGRVADIVIDGDELFVVTTRGLVHALHAESGRTLWTARVGRRSFPITSPAVNQKFVALTNGSTLYVLDRTTGLPIWDVSVGGSPSAGTALGANWVYVPLSNGIVEGYHLTDRERDNLMHAAAGIPENSPLATPLSVICATASGWIYSCDPDTMIARFRVETGETIMAPLSYADPHVIAASRDGYVYAFHEEEGVHAWRFSAGHPVSHKPVVIGDVVYVISESGGMHQLSTELGTEIWHIENVARFIAASATKVYVADQLGRMIVLDAATGARLDWLPTTALSVKPVNSVSDRVFLGSSDGLLQALREIELHEPVRHVAPAEVDPALDAPPAGEDPGAAPVDGAF